jgi:hypothetical protein
MASMATALVESRERERIEPRRCARRRGGGGDRPGRAGARDPASVFRWSPGSSGA